MTTLFPIAMILFMAIIFYFSFGRVFRQMKNRKRLSQEGSLSTAVVVSISQTGTTVNQVPEMRLVLDIDNTTGKPHRLEIRQLIDLGNIPRAGDRVYVLIDPKNPDNVVLSPVSSGNGIQIPVVDDAGKQTGTMDLGSREAKDYMSLPAELRERGKPGVAKLITVEPADGGLYKITMDLDYIGKPPKRVTIMQRFDGFAPAAGTRLYYIYDPQTPNVLALAPASMTQGQTLGVGANRLDPLVLGPQLLKEGTKAVGKVLSVQSASMVNPMLAAQGYSKWALVLEVTPEDPQQNSYQAQLTTSLSSKEKADRIAHVGAEVPLRYDPADLQTICIDSIEMGYPDPYEAVLKTFEQQLSNKG